MSLLNSFIDEKSYFDNLSFSFPEDILSVGNDFSSQDFKSWNFEKKSKSIKFNVLKNKRKNSRDNIMKKIKSAAHRKIISDINIKLKTLGPKFTFKPLPQHFITDVTQETNYKAMQLTYRDLIDFTYKNLKDAQKYRKKPYNKKSVPVSNKNYNHNKKILDYLDTNSEISEKSGLIKIMNTKYIDLLRDFFSSNEFELIVCELSQGKDKNYFNLYKFFSEIYLDFFANYKPKKTKIKTIVKNNNVNGIFGVNSKKDINNVTQNPNSNAIINNSNNYNLINPFLIVEEKDLLGNYNSSFLEDLRDENSLIFDDIILIKEDDN